MQAFHPLVHAQTRNAVREYHKSMPVRLGSSHVQTRNAAHKITRVNYACSAEAGCFTLSLMRLFVGSLDMKEARNDGHVIKRLHPEHATEKPEIYFRNRRRGGVWGIIHRLGAS